MNDVVTKELKALLTNFKSSYLSYPLPTLIEEIDDLLCIHYVERLKYNKTKKILKEVVKQRNDERRANE